MKRGSTLFLKLVIFLMAIAALAICIFVLPRIAAEDAAAHPDLAYQQYPFLAYSYTLCIAFFVTLYQAFKLLTYIDGNQIFSALSVKALKYIKLSAITIGVLTTAGVMTLMILSIGKGEDIAGVIMLGLIITFIAAVGATITAVLQKHLQQAIEIKSENDLTV